MPKAIPVTHLAQMISIATLSLHLAYIELNSYSVTTLSQQGTYSYATTTFSVLDTYSYATTTLSIHDTSSSATTTLSCQVPRAIPVLHLPEAKTYSYSIYST